MNLPPDSSAPDSTPNPPSSSDSTHHPTPQPTETEENFEQALERLGRSLQTLRDRYQEVTAAQQRQAQLQEQLQQVNAELQRPTPPPDLLAERQRIEQELTELAAILESRLISWSSFREGFWQAIRFGGLGIVIGWVLRGCADR